MVPAGHVARIGVIHMACTGEPVQHTSTHLLLRRGEDLRCQRTGLGEVDLPDFARREHPVDHAAVEVHIGIQHIIHGNLRVQSRLSPGSRLTILGGT